MKVNDASVESRKAKTERAPYQQKDDVDDDRKSTCDDKKQKKAKQNGVKDASIESRKAKTERAHAKLLHGNDNEYLVPQQVNFVVASVAQEHVVQPDSEVRCPVRSKVGQSHGEPVRETHGVSSLLEHGTATDIKGKEVTKTLSSTCVDNVAHVIPAGDNCGGVPDSKAERPRSGRSLRPRYGSASRCMQRLVGSEFDAPARTPLPDKSYLERDFEAKFVSFWPTSVPGRREKPRAAGCSESDGARRSHVNDTSAACVSNSSLNRKSVRFDASHRGTSAGGAGQHCVTNKDVGELSPDDLPDPPQSAVYAPRSRSGYGVRRQYASDRRTSDESLVNELDKAQGQATAHLHDDTSTSVSHSRDNKTIKSMPEQGRVADTSKIDTVVLAGKPAPRRSTLDKTHGGATTKHDPENVQRVSSQSRSRSRDLVPGQKSRCVPETNQRSPFMSPDNVTERQETVTLSRETPVSHRRSKVVTPAKSHSEPNRHQIGSSGCCFNAPTLTMPPTRRASCTCSDIGPTRRDGGKQFWASASAPRTCGVSKEVAQNTSNSSSIRRSQNSDSTSRKDAAHIHYTPSPHSRHSDTLPVGRRACAKTGNAGPALPDERDQSDSDSNSSCSTNDDMEQQSSPVRAPAGGVHPSGSVPGESMPELTATSPGIERGATASMREVHQHIINQHKLLLLSSQKSSFNVGL